MAFIYELDETIGEVAVHLKVKVASVFQEHARDVFFFVVNRQNLNIFILRILRIYECFEVIVLQVDPECVLGDVLIVLNYDVAFCI